VCGLLSHLEVDARIDDVGLCHVRVRMRRTGEADHGVRCRCREVRSMTMRGGEEDGSFPIPGQHL